jgi:hypothetical protein
MTEYQVELGTDKFRKEIDVREGADAFTTSKCSLARRLTKVKGR